MCKHCPKTCFSPWAEDYILCRPGGRFPTDAPHVPFRAGSDVCSRIDRWEWTILFTGTNTGRSRHSGGNTTSTASIRTLTLCWSQTLSALSTRSGPCACGKRLCSDRGRVGASYETILLCPRAPLRGIAHRRRLRSFVCPEGALEPRGAPAPRRGWR